MADKKDIWAVLKIQGRQYIASPGSVLMVDKVVGDKVEADVLMTSDGDKLEIGTPILDKIKATLKIVEPLVKGEKIRVFKYKAKSRYQKTRGFRPSFTKVLVEKIA